MPQDKEEIKRMSLDETNLQRKHFIVIGKPENDGIMTQLSTRYLNTEILDVHGMIPFRHVQLIVLRECAVEQRQTKAWKRSFLV